MMITNDEVTISRETWDELYQNELYREILEMIEDIELLKKAKSEPAEFVDLDDYHNQRIGTENV